eukprot:scaffold16903_cov133-Isochrysis_galbana.AAC.2
MRHAGLRRWNRRRRGGRGGRLRRRAGQRRGRSRIRRRRAPQHGRPVQRRRGPRSSRAQTWRGRCEMSRRRKVVRARPGPFTRRIVSRGALHSTGRRTKEHVRRDPSRSSEPNCSKHAGLLRLQAGGGIRGCVALAEIWRGRMLAHSRAVPGQALQLRPDPTARSGGGGRQLFTDL